MQIEIVKTMSESTSTKTTLHVAADQPEITQSKQYKSQKRKKVPIEGKVAALENTLTESERRVSSGEKARMNTSHLLVQEMTQRITASDAKEQIVLKDELEESAPLHKRFKTIINVDEGSTLRQIEKDIAEENPNLTLPTVRARARAQLKKTEKEKSRLQWQSNSADSALMPVLRSDRSPEMQALLSEFEKHYAILSANAPHEAMQQEAFNDLRKKLVLQMKKTRRVMRKKAQTVLQKKNDDVVQPTMPPPPPKEPMQQRATVTNDDDDNDVSTASTKKSVAPLDYNVTDRSLLSLPPTLQTSSQKTNTGLVVGKNSFGEVISPDIYPVTSFASMFAAEKSRSEEMMGTDSTRFIARFHAETVNAFYKMLDSAPSDSCLTASGQRPSGSIAHDMRLLLEERGFNASVISSERMLKYQALWQQTNTAVPADIENALALRVIQIDRDNAAELMRNIGMAEHDIKSSLIHGKTVEHAAFLRAIFASMVSDSFISAEEQAEAETSLAKRVAVDLKKAKKDTQKPTTTGSRGLEALGMKIDSIPALTLKMLGVSIEEITRQYIQEFMRPAFLPGERPCSRGDLCLCMTMAASFPSMSAPDGKGCGFICKEFLLPSQVSTYKAHGKLPEYRFMCVICERAIVTAAVYDHVQNRKEPQMPLHRFTVPIEGEKGYRRDQLLDITACGTRLTGIVGPFPALNPQNLVYSKLSVEGRIFNCIIESETDFRMGSASILRT